MKIKQRKRKFSGLYFFKFPILFIIYTLLLLIPVEKLTHENNTAESFRYNAEEKRNFIEGEVEDKRLNNTTSSPGFDWSVTKIDDNVTSMSLPPDPRMSTAEELFEAMNTYRKAHGVSTLSKNDMLCDVAQNRANEQIANGGLDGHAGFSKHFNDQNEFNRVGEVLFGGSQPQYGVHIVEFGWDRSLTGHKEAIRNPVWNHGCGGIADYYAVFIFGTK